MTLKSVNPKISRIGRQKRNNEFFSFVAERTHLVNYFKKLYQKVRFSFLFFKICKTSPNSATGLSAAAMNLEIWRMFNIVIWTYHTLVLYIVCGASPKLHSGLNFV